MALEVLLEALERDARAEAERRRHAAQAEAEALIARSAADLDRRRHRAMAELEHGRGADVAREAAAAARALKTRVLEARAALLERVFSEAVARLARLEQSRWAARLPTLAAQTLVYLDGEVDLICQPGVERLLGPSLAGRTEVRLVADPAAPAGLVGRSRDGAVEVDNSWRARLDRKREDLAIRLLQRLKGDAGALG